MSFTFPLEWPAGWPRRAAESRETSRFRVGADEARKDLMRTLEMMCATGVVISTNRPIRANGTPYAEASRGEDPGVAVYFTIRDRPMVMARDCYLLMDANLRSIGHAVNHLRGLERHGGATMMERAFDGFAALPAPGQVIWWQILQLPANATVTEVEAAYRRLALVRHPDRGGSEAMMSDLNIARDIGRREARP